MKNVFERCRSISAADVTRAAGIPLRRRGDREWCCCPIHREKTASCCFFPNGRWYCFGCHAGGDAVEMYVALHGGSKLDAAHALSDGNMPRTVKHMPLQHRPGFLDGVDREGLTWDQLCRVRNHAAAEMEQGGDVWAALKIKAEAETRLDEMEDAESARASIIC